MLKWLYNVLFNGHLKVHGKPVVWRCLRDFMSIAGGVPIASMAWSVCQYPLHKHDMTEYDHHRPFPLTRLTSRIFSRLSTLLSTTDFCFQFVFPSVVFVFFVWFRAVDRLRSGFSTAN